jgi:NAD(P)-dependent dehydrogenase (short-subunit alcohol dehydrogenase family)
VTESEFEQNVVLVTGGASGVGRKVAEVFLARGASVHVCDASAEHIDDLLNKHPDATASLCDIGDSAQVGSAFDDFRAKYDRLDVLVNNAGVAGQTGSVEDLGVEHWDRCVDVNLNGTFYTTRLAVPFMKKQEGGAIINMASTAGLFGCPNRSPYAASKWAMIGLTKTWAMELGPHNIRVNAICPTCVEGDRIDSVIDSDAANRGLTSEEIRDVYKRQTSMRTFVTADDVANMALFLASEQAARISGQTIAVDGHTETLANWLDH